MRKVLSLIVGSISMVMVTGCTVGEVVNLATVLPDAIALIQTLLASLNV